MSIVTLRNDKVLLPLSALGTVIKAKHEWFDMTLDSCGHYIMEMNERIHFITGDVRLSVARSFPEQRPV